MAYEVDYYAKFVLPKSLLKTVQANYLAWLLGYGPYTRSKDSRRKIGVNSAWTADQVAQAKRLRGFDDFELDARASADRWMLRYRHRDAENPAVLFEHLIRLTQVGATVEVEHGIQRSAPRELLVPLSKAVRPRIIEDLSGSAADVAPKNLNLKPITLRSGDVAPFVTSQLFDPSSVPWVVISLSEETKASLVDLRPFAQWFEGMAAVAVLDSVAASFALTTALKKAGVGDEMRCFGGAIRLYDNTHGPQRLPFLMPNQISVWTGLKERTSHAGYELSRRMAVRKMPPDFFLAIEAEDHLERSRQREAVKAELANDSATTEELRAKLQDFEGLLAAADAENQQLRKDALDGQEVRLSLEIDRDEVMSRLDEVQREARAESARLSDEVTALRAGSRVAKLSPELREAVAALLSGEHSPIRAVEVTELLFGDRLTFLQSAKDSARAAAKFEWPEEVGSLLVRLATDYYDALQMGAGDAEARKVFGVREYAAKEATLSTKGRALRTFRWNGGDHFMESHLKVGTKASDAKCLRIHFMWDPEHKRIVVGHVGGHLNL